MLSDSPITTIQRELAEGSVIVLDGGTGTELERRGAAMHTGAWCAMATLTAPETLREIHEDYIRAGARVITANTFSANRLMLEPAGIGDRFTEITSRAVEIALEARDRVDANRTVAVAGSMSHQIPLPPGSDHRDPSKIPPPELVKGHFQEMATTLAGLGVDFLLLEMMSDPALANPAIAAAEATGLPLWIGYSCMADDQGAAISWTNPELDVSEMVQSTATKSAGAIGIMHTNVNLISASIRSMQTQWDGPIMAYPDTGHFEMPNWQWDDAISAPDLADAAVRWIDEGARLVGGCCGIGVEHIEALANAVARSG